MTLKKYLWVFLFTSLYLFLAPGAFSDPQPIKIGMIVPLSGDMAAVSAACRDAALLAIEDLKGRTKNSYELIVEDDRLTPSEVAKAAQKLISVDKVSAIISTWSYGGKIVNPLAERAKIPHIGIAWDHTIADGDYSFLHLTPPSEFMRLFLEAFQKLGVKRVALLGVEESGSVFALDQFTEMAPKYGVNVVFRDSVLFDTKDFNSIVARIAKAKPDYLLFNFGGDGLISALLQSLKSQQVKFRYTAITAFDVVSNVQEIEGHWYVSDSYLKDDFIKRFHERYGHTISYGVGNFYEATRLLVQSFESSDPPTPENSQKVLSSIKNQPSIFGLTNVDGNGIFSYPAKYLRIENGKRVLIGLEDIKE